MRLFRFKGGVHPDENKTTHELPIAPMPVPTRLYLPLQQHIGSPAAPIVEVGEQVKKGQLLATATGPISAPVHASTSGVIIAIDDWTAPHPSGLPVKSIILESDGKNAWCEKIVPIDPFKLSPEAIAQRVGEAGIVGMGGAAFPAAVKLNLGTKNRIHTLIINGGECEPYLTCDDRLMQERPSPIIDGTRLMLKALGCKRALIAVENNKPEAQRVLREVAAASSEIEVVGVPTRYPMGSEKQMIQTLTGLEVPAGGLGADIGVLVHNVATAYAVHQALRHGRPLVSRIVTVSGSAVAAPANLEVPLGTLAADLVAHCGGLKKEAKRQLLGGPMMGTALPHLKVPIVKGSNGVLVLGKDEMRLQPTPRPCIRCARCVEACPLGLIPLEMAARARSGDMDGALEFGLRDCIACGTCSYICPSSIPLTQYFNFAKGELARTQQEKQKSDFTRQLAQSRQERLEREAREKKEAAARRKAEREAKRRTAEAEKEKESAS
ncbi:MAG: electron transport complex subunit RsxC [Pseudomonadota bacterium]